MTLRERIARKLHALAYDKVGGWTATFEQTRASWLSDADAVLQVLREPSGPMIEAGCADLFGADLKLTKGWPEHLKGAARSGFTAMIDAAIGERDA